MNFDIECECGNPDCHSEVNFRVGPAWLEDDNIQEGWLYIDATDMKGQYVELMLTPATKKQLIKQLKRLK